MLASFILSFTFIPLVAYEAPLFSLGSSEATGASTPLSLNTINTTLLGPAQLARAAYCPSDSIKSWSRGLPCDSLKGMTFLQEGGGTSIVP
jgi:hypothetical protein